MPSRGGIVGDIPDEVDDPDEDSSLTRSAILGALGIGGGTWAALSAFGDRLAEADSFADLVINIILQEFVGWILTFAGYAYETLILTFQAISEALWLSTVAPLSEIFWTLWEALFDSMDSVRISTEAALANAGFAAPFVALGGWVAVLLLAAVLVGVAWALLETYLPVEAIVENVERAIDVVLIPARTLADVVRSVLESIRGLFGGDTNE